VRYTINKPLFPYSPGPFFGKAMLI
jgi:hypothetical protein